MKEYSPVAKRTRLALTAAALVPLSVFAAACSSTGSSLLYPLMGAWTAAYQKQFTDSSGKLPLVTIETGSTGSGTGITDASTGTINIGASDAYLSSSDLQTYPSMENIALAISAQQINYNLPTVKTPLKLDGTVLTEIYSGKITKWNDKAIA